MNNKFLFLVYITILFIKNILLSDTCSSEKKTCVSKTKNEFDFDYLEETNPEEPLQSNKDNHNTETNIKDNSNLENLKETKSDYDVSNITYRDLFNKD